MKDVVARYCRRFRNARFEFIRHRHLDWVRHVTSKLERNTTPVRFQCNICGAFSEAYAKDIYEREMESCETCRSSLRARSIIHVLSQELFGKDVILPEFPKDKSIVGLGTSDWEGYAVELGKRLSYQNTHFHKEPRLDLTDVPDDLVGTCDFVISSEVLEHIAPPVSTAFSNLFRLLKDGGLCLLTVPFMNFETTWEHFPHLYDYSLLTTGNGARLENTTREGRKEVFDELVFHGGDGATLEMRIFTRSSLKKTLRDAGFVDIAFHRSHATDYGIAWPLNWSLPVTARKPRLR